VRKTPGWAECRYLRTLESLAATGASRREYVILWAFAHADEQWGYCLDVAAEFARRFPGDALAPKLSAEPLAQIERTLQKQAEAARGTLLGRVKRRVKSMLGRGQKKKPEVELAARPPGVLLPTAASR